MSNQQDPASHPADPATDKANDAASAEGKVLSTPTNSLSPSLAPIATRHPLQNRWSMWYNSCSKDAWEPRHIASMTTVEEFWCLYNNLLPPSRIPLGNYHFFKNGIEPTWEDAANQKGGKWWFELPKSESALMDDLWLWTLLALIGEYFETSEDINGAVVSPRARVTKLALWTTCNDEARMRKIGQAWREALRIGGEFFYLPHNPDSSQFPGGKVPKYLYKEPQY